MPITLQCSIMDRKTSSDFALQLNLVEKDKILHVTVHPVLSFDSMIHSTTAIKQSAKDKSTSCMTIICIIACEANWMFKFLRIIPN